MRMLQSKTLILGFFGPGKYDKKTEKKDTLAKLEKKIHYCTAKTVKLMFSNVAYRSNVYKTGENIFPSS